MSDSKYFDNQSGANSPSRRGFIRSGIHASTVLSLGALVASNTSLTGTLAWADVAGVTDAGAAAKIKAGMTKSDLIYLAPIKSNGTVSRCQAEVWFQEHEGAMYVVTAHHAWRAKAVTLGLTATQVWVGDVGQWQSADGEYQKLPRLTATASLIDDAATRAAVLDKMGSKYRMSWLRWGPKFKNGLADGSRVMLRYAPA